MSHLSISDRSDPDELVEAVCRAMVREAPADWSRIELNYRASSTVCQADVSASAEDGRTLLIGVPDEVHEVLRELRALMADDRRGAWLSARFALVKDGAPDIRFNHTEDPGWSPPVDPGVLARDLEDFPRAPEHIPAWLHEQLEQAESNDEGSDETPGAATGR